MRTVTFSDAKVVQRLNSEFICLWKNIRTGEKYGDGMYPNLLQLPNGTGENNVCAHVARPDGTIVHSVQGYTDQKKFIEEIDFGLQALALRAKNGPPADLAGLYLDRSEALAADKSDRWQTLMKLNLKILAGSPGLNIDRTPAQNQAGLR